MKEYKYKIKGVEYTVTINKIEDNSAELEVNGNPYSVELVRDKKAEEKKAVVKRPTVTTPPVAKVVSAAPSSASGIKAPLPGVIIDVLVNVGDTVKRGQKVAILEAMKMENNINSDMDGVVKEVKVKKGDAILEGTDIIVIG